MTITNEFGPLFDQLSAPPLNTPVQPHLSSVSKDYPLALTPGIDPIVLDSWQTQDGADVRSHRLLHLDLPGQRHRLLHTGTEGGRDSDLVIANLPGWTETLSGFVLRKTHARLSHELPDAIIDTHATYGTDGTLSHANPLVITKQSLENAAQKTFNAFLPLYDDKRLVLVATSMGAAILARMEEINQSEGSPLDIVGRILYEPCLVLPEHAGVRMFSRLAIHLTINTLDEIVHQSSPRAALSFIEDGVHSLPPFTDLPVIWRLGWSLLGWTRPELLNSLAERHPTVIQGKHDVLREPAFEGHPDVVIKLLQGKGHCMSNNSTKRALAIAKAVRAMGLHQPR